MKTLRYEIVDVFTDRPYAGNPLAVVLDAEELDGSQMRTIAREFNLSETAFVLPPSDGADYKVRIFTPTHELPFAGHPSVGTAVTLARLGRLRAGDMVQECGAGMLPVSVANGAAKLTGGQPEIGGELDPGPLLAAVGLGVADHHGAAPRAAGCGISFFYLPVHQAALERAKPDAAALRVLGQSGISVFSWDPDSGTAHARVFCEPVGVLEDPATGSAALGLGVWLVAAGLAPGDGETGYAVRQGVEIRRPSRLDCTVAAEHGVATSATVAGEVTPVAAGEIAVPPFVG
ncbi:MAG: PhzF family phenazine biosynthesis protein [Micromonosporaceae bacterium]